MLRTTFSLGICAVVLGTLSMLACTETAATTASNDAGDAGFEVPSNDAGPAADASVDVDACKPGPPPAGLAQLAPTDKSGDHIVMTLDDASSPIVAYQTNAADGSPTQVTVWVRRWDPTCSVWGEPMKIDSFGGATSNGRQIALAFDKSTGAVGIAYAVQVGVLPAVDHYEIRYAQLAKGAAAFTAPARVEQPRSNDGAPTGVGLGMANGSVFAAYIEPYRLCGTSGCAAVVYRSRDAAGTWSAEIELPGNGQDGLGDPRDANVSIAVDSEGKPAVAFIGAQGIPMTGGVDMKAVFVRPGTAGFNTIFDNADSTGTDFPWVELAFDGTKPRAVVIMNKDANYSTTRDTEWFVASDVGTTWLAPVALPHDMGASNDTYASLAIGAGGRVVIASYSNASNGTDVFGQPKLYTSTDLTTFATGGVPKTVYDGTSSWVSAKIGSDDKLQLVMEGSAGPDPTHLGALYYKQ